MEILERVPMALINLVYSDIVKNGKSNRHSYDYHIYTSPSLPYLFVDINDGDEFYGLPLSDDLMVNLKSLADKVLP